MAALHDGTFKAIGVDVIKVGALQSACIAELMLWVLLASAAVVVTVEVEA